MVECQDEVPGRNAKENGCLPEGGALLSVIVPVYNVEAYLRRCLDSLCSQSYSHLEIICVDDGSTDGSLAILREYEAKDSRIRVVSKPNGGVSSARNAALDVATGVWMTGVDPDDYMVPDAYSIAMSYARDEVALVNFGVNVVAAPGLGLEQSRASLANYLKSPYTGVQPMSPLLVFNVAWNNVNKLYRRSIIEAHGIRYDESILVAEDMCFHMTFCAYADKMAFCPEQLYVYELRKGSAMYSRDKVGTRLWSYVAVMRNLLKVYQEAGLMDSYALFFKHLFTILNPHVERWSFVAGQPFLWRKRLLEQVGQYHLQEREQVGPVVRELAEQLRCAQWVYDVLGDCAAQAAVPGEYEEGTSHIAVPVDRTHAGQAALLLRSLQQAATAGRKLCIHYLCDGVAPSVCSQLRGLAGERLQVCVYEVPHGLLNQLPPLSDVFPHAAYLKMMIPLLLPDVSRVLVLSPGLLLRGGLPFWDAVDMAGMPVAALFGLPVAGREQSAARLGTENYVSSELLLMDLAQMREQNRVESWVAACMFAPHRTLCPEADSFNRAFRTLVAELPDEWMSAVSPLSSAELLNEAYAQEAWLPGLPVDGARLYSWGSSPESRTHASQGESEHQPPEFRMVALAQQYGQLRRRYYYYKLMSGLTWGRKKRHYKEQRRLYRDILRQLRQYFRDARQEWGLRQ